LKPDNVFLVDEDGEMIPKVLDFGIAKSIRAGGDGLVTRTGLTIGTPYYMSPEQAEGKKSVDQRTDLWAMGIIASECLTGHRPISGETFGEILLNICARPIPLPSSLASVPQGFDAWFTKSTAINPDERFSDAKEQASALSEVLSAVPASAPSGFAGHAPTVAFEGATAQAVSVAAGAPAVADAKLGTDRGVSVGVESIPLKRTNPSLLIGAVVAALGVGAGLWFALAGSSAPSDADPAAAASAQADESKSSAAAPSNAEPAANPNQEPGVTPVDAPKPGALEANEPTPAPAVPVVATPPAPAPSQPKAAPAPTPRAAPAPAPAAKSASLWCVKDDFTGALKRAPSGAKGKFACTKDPFTGRYARK
jgi:serine/threonine-protein kinase